MDPKLGQWEIPGVVSISELTPNYPVVSISNSFAKVDIALHGAHVMRFQPNGSGPVLWLSNSAHYIEGKAIRGGIPICWPWFGAKTENKFGDTVGSDSVSSSKDSASTSYPAHGFVRSQFWGLKSTQHDETGTEIIFILQSSQETMRIWPHQFSLELRVHVSKVLSVSLDVTNLDENYFTFTGALHTYLAVADITQSTLSGLDGTPYIDTLSNESKTQIGDFSIGSEFDNIYQPTSAKVVVCDEIQNRELHVEKTGSLSTVVWNPWIEKSSRMSDFDEGGYRHMVCVEAANTDGDIVVLQPQESHCLSTTISVRDINLDSI